MADVKVKFKRTKGTINRSSVRIDDKALKFDSSGSATKKNVKAGDHTLICTVWGEPGAQFKISIEAPTEAKWKPSTKQLSKSIKTVTKAFRINKPKSKKATKGNKT